MTCPDCGESLTDGFGRRECAQCGARFLSSIHGLKPIVIPRVIPRSVRMLRVLGNVIPQCTKCGEKKEIYGTALVMRAGGRWPIKGPICKDCAGSFKWVADKHGELVCEVKLLPYGEFHASIHKTPLNADGGEVEKEPRFTPRTLWKTEVDWC